MSGNLGSNVLTNTGLVFDSGLALDSRALFLEIFNALLIALSIQFSSYSLSINIFLSSVILRSL